MNSRAVLGNQLPKPQIHLHEKDYYKHEGHDLKKVPHEEQLKKYHLEQFERNARVKQLFLCTGREKKCNPSEYDQNTSQKFLDISVSRVASHLVFFYHLFAPP